MRVYDYYDVDIPDDFSTDPDERGQQAFIQAEHRTRLYCIPCLWRVVSDDGQTVRVCRIRNKKVTK